MSQLKERYEKVQTRKQEALTRAMKVVAELGKSFFRFGISSECGL